MDWFGADTRHSPLTFDLPSASGIPLTLHSMNNWSQGWAACPTLSTLQGYCCYTTDVVILKSEGSFQQLAVVRHN